MSKYKTNGFLNVVTLYLSIGTRVKVEIRKVAATVQLIFPSQNLFLSCRTTDLCEIIEHKKMRIDSEELSEKMGMGARCLLSDFFCFFDRLRDSDVGEVLASECEMSLDVLADDGPVLLAVVIVPGESVIKGIVHDSQARFSSFAVIGLGNSKSSSLRPGMELSLRVSR